VNRTLVGEVSSLHCQLLELARSLELRSGAYRAPALPVELSRGGIELNARNQSQNLTWEKPRCVLPMSWASIAGDFLHKLERVGEKKNQVVCRMHYRRGSGRPG